MMNSLFKLSSGKAILGAIGLGLFCAFFAPHAFTTNLAKGISFIFLNMLQLVSVPLISFSLISTLTGMGDWTSIKSKTAIIFKFTILTTLASALLALILYQIIKPGGTSVAAMSASQWLLPEVSLKQLAITFLPNNMLQPFVEHNVMGVMFIALLFSVAILQLKEAQQTLLHNLFESLFQMVMVIIRWIVVAMPLAVWAFTVLFIEEFNHGLAIASLSKYLAVIVLANLIHGAIVLPLFLRAKNIKPLEAFKFFSKAISLAFFSKSSVAALPVAIDCARLYGIDSKHARFSFPLCTSINMNACAAFILITVLFVSEQHGFHYNFWQLLGWVFMATLAAIGNAGVPMGCFFLSGALLAAMGVPVTLMGIILPFYALLDMLESGINIWSDVVVTLIYNDHQKKLALT